MVVERKHWGTPVCLKKWVLANSDTLLIFDSCQRDGLVSNSVIDFVICVFTNAIKKKAWGTNSCIYTARTRIRNHHLSRNMAEAYMEKCSDSSILFPGGSRQPRSQPSEQTSSSKYERSLKKASLNTFLFSWISLISLRNPMKVRIHSNFYTVWLVRFITTVNYSSIVSLPFWSACRWCYAGVWFLVFIHFIWFGSWHRCVVWRNHPYQKPVSMCKRSAMPLYLQSFVHSDTYSRVFRWICLPNKLIQQNNFKYKWLAERKQKSTDHCWICSFSKGNSSLFHAFVKRSCSEINKASMESLWFNAGRLSERIKSCTRVWRNFRTSASLSRA